ncbi:hypothetical protein OIE69_39705 [Actinacidiphila glaucinigra]|uniref:hypothetical protein n=1 Tax=Actinacidiphila glaucinigra TaxID=235986 RepID=UPI002DD8086F|nr:hypothetical protein [Actinacidiphila glaucinigra]WSD64589.1 hypothetical protein OIE69_39705 [Actinacidiphila glaucinigra]
MRIRRLVAITAATGTLALGLAACGDSAEDAAPKAGSTQGSAKPAEKKEATPVEALQNATKAVEQQASAKVSVDAVDPADGNTKAEGTLSWEKGSEAAELSMDAASDPDLQDMAGPDGKVHMTMADGGVYLPVEGEMAEAAGGKKWLKLDGASAEDNPAADLPHGPAAALAALSTAPDLAEAGKEQVAGAEATHYTGTVDIKKLAADTAVLELIGKDERDAYVKELRTTGLKNTVKIEAWIGADDLAVQTVESGTTAKGAAKLTIGYSGYGKTSAIKVPPAKDVTTFAEMLQNAAQG